jgi:microcompartment protein CcmL/EutN
MDAVGILEVYGLTAAFVAADAGCKAGNVTIGAMDKNKPANADKLPVPLLVSIKFRGSVEDVKAAMEAGEAAAKKISGVYSKYVIPRPETDTEKMLDISCLGKYKPAET